MTMTINGSGTITGLSAGGLPDATIQQADLATNVAGNGPAFSAYVGTTQSFTSGVWTKVQINAELFDTNSAFDTGTYRFQPLVAGYYQFTGNLVFAFSGTASIVGVSVYKTGTPQFDTTLYATQNNGTTALTSKLLYLNGSTDYAELWTYCNGTAPNFTASFSSYFSATLVRAA